MSEPRPEQCVRDMEIALAILNERLWGLRNQLNVAPSCKMEFKVDEETDWHYVKVSFDVMPNFLVENSIDQKWFHEKPPPRSAIYK